MSHTYQQLWTFIFGICGEFGASSTKMHVILQFVLWWLVDSITGMHSFMTSHHKIFSRLQRLQNKAAKVIFAVGRRVVNMSPHSWKTFIGSLSSKGQGSSSNCLSTSTSVFTIKVQDISLTIFNLHIYSPRRTGLRSSSDTTLLTIPKSSKLMIGD